MNKPLTNEQRKKVYETAAETYSESSFWSIVNSVEFTAALLYGYFEMDPELFIFHFPELNNERIKRGASLRDFFVKKMPKEECVDLLIQLAQRVPEFKTINSTRP